MRHTLILFVLSCFYCLPAMIDGPMADGLTVYVSKPVEQQESIGRVDLSSTTATYSVIKSENFEKRHTELGKLIEHETGIQVRSSGGVGGFSSASIRGSTSEQVAVYVDGVPLSQASGGAVDLSLISLDDVQSVELFRGSVPMELGNASLGGAINIISKQAKDGFNAKLKATLGSFNTRQYNVFASAGTGKNSLILSANSLKSDNDFEFINDNGTGSNPNDDRKEKRNNSALKKETALAKWNYRLNENENIDTKLEWLENYQQIPGSQNNENADAFQALKNLDFFSQYNHKRFFSMQAEFSAKIFGGRLDDHFLDAHADNGLLARDVDSSTDNLGAEVFYKYKSENYHFKYRFLYENQKYISETVISPLSNDNSKLLEKQDSVRDFYEQSLEYKRFSLQNSLISSITLRQVYAQDTNNQIFDVSGNPVDVEDRKYNVLTPQLGLKYKFNALSYVNFNIGKYVRLPSFFELFGSQGYFRGSPNLKEESGVNMDVGYVYSVFKPGNWLDDAKFYIGFFHNTVKNLIVRESNNEGIVAAKNVADAKINGIETNVKIYPSINWSVLFNATYLNSKNTSDRSAYDGNSLPNQFEQDYSLHISYSIQQWVAGFSWDIKKDMYYDRPNLLPATDISDINLSLLKNWQHHSLEFKVENVLDNQYENFLQQPTAGTSYYLTYMYRL